MCGGESIPIWRISPPRLNLASPRRLSGLVMQEEEEHTLVMHSHVSQCLSEAQGGEWKTNALQCNFYYFAFLMAFSSN